MVRKSYVNTSFWCFKNWDGHFELILFYFIFYPLCSIIVVFSNLLLWVKQFCKSAHTNNNVIIINIIECEIIKIGILTHVFGP